MRKFKTPAKSRTNYKYYGDDGRVLATVKPVFLSSPKPATRYKINFRH
jgi:hypothetical protein